MLQKGFAVTVSGARVEWAIALPAPSPLPITSPLPLTSGAKATAVRAVLVVFASIVLGHLVLHAPF